VADAEELILSNLKLVTLCLAVEESEWKLKAEEDGSGGMIRSTATGMMCI
jgi:hypothetical protein